MFFFARDWDASLRLETAFLFLVTLGWRQVIPRSHETGGQRRFKIPPLQRGNNKHLTLSNPNGSPRGEHHGYTVSAAPFVGYDSATKNSTARTHLGRTIATGGYADFDASVVMAACGIRHVQHQRLRRWAGCRAAIRHEARRACMRRAGHTVQTGLSIRRQRDHSERTSDSRQNHLHLRHTFPFSKKRHQGVFPKIA